MNFQCIYFDGKNGRCFASSPYVSSYTPDAEMQEKFCKNEMEMKDCPRLHEYEDYLKASGGTSRLEKTKKK